MSLTERDIEQIQYHGRKGTAHYIWDDEVKGLGVRIYPTGRKAFVLTYRAAGRQRFLTLGSHGKLSLHDARTEALEKRVQIRRGGDPSADRLPRHGSPTVADLADRYQREHAEVKKKASSAKADRRYWEMHVLPRLGQRKVAEVPRADIAGLHAAMAAKPYLANRVLALLSKAFNLAEVWGWRPDSSNPSRHIERYREEKRERFLSEEELGRLSAALRQAEREQTEPPPVVAAVRLLILTGCRVGEILKLRWTEVDFERRCLRLSDTKTGRRTVPLNAAAAQVLVDIDRDGENPWVIRGAKRGRHLYTLSRPWERIRERAGLDDVRLHDLRHTFASIGAAAGLSLPVIGKLLGHTQVTTTQRCAHLADDPVRRASEKVGAKIGAAMSRTERAVQSLTLTGPTSPS